MVVHFPANAIAGGGLGGSHYFLSTPGSEGLEEVLRVDIDGDAGPPRGPRALHEFVRQRAQRGALFPLEEEVIAESIAQPGERCRSRAEQRH